MNSLLSLFTQLSDLAPSMLGVAFLVFMRVGAVMALLPAFGELAVPQRIRLALAIAFTAIVAPAVTISMPTELMPLMFVALIEAGIGLVLGFGFRLFVQTLQIAGAIAAQSISVSQIAGGAVPEPQPAVGQLLVVAGLALAAASGLHVRVAQVLILSYDLFPAGTLPDAGDLARWGLGRTAYAFALALSLSAPFVIASILYNLALGVINRAMPALMVMLIGAPLQVLAGLALLLMSAPMALSLWEGAFQTFLDAPFASPK